MEKARKKEKEVASKLARLYYEAGGGKMRKPKLVNVRLKVRDNKNGKIILEDESGKGYIFNKLGYQRYTTDSQAARIINAINSGHKFLTTVKVNYLANKDEYTLLDGYHRMKALEIYGDYYDFVLQIYEDLSSDEERLIYEDGGLQRAHEIDDLLHPFEKDITVLNLIKDEGFPVEVSFKKSKQIISPTVLTKAYSFATGGHSVTRGNALAIIKRLLYKDYRNLYEFLEMMVKINYHYSRDRWMWKNSIIYALYRLYYANVIKGKHSKKDFHKLLNRICKSAVCHDMARSVTSGTRMSLNFCRYATEFVNSSRKKGRITYSLEEGNGSED